jgi:hypothetical protein
MTREITRIPRFGFTGILPAFRSGRVIAVGAKGLAPFHSVGNRDNGSKEALQQIRL